MKNILKFISSEMKNINIDYHFIRNRKSKISYPYFVGELLPVDNNSEDGLKEFTLVIDGFNRGTLFELLEVCEKIEENFPYVEGKNTMLEKEFIVVYSSSPQVIDTDDEQIQRIQMNLTIKAWKGGQ